MPVQFKNDIAALLHVTPATDFSLFLSAHTVEHLVRYNEWRNLPVLPGINIRVQLTSVFIRVIRTGCKRKIILHAIQPDFTVNIPVNQPAAVSDIIKAAVPAALCYGVLLCHNDLMLSGKIKRSALRCPVGQESAMSLPEQKDTSIIPASLPAPEYLPTRDSTR